MSDADPVPTVLVMHRDDALRAEVRRLLVLMAMLDPTGSKERNDDWPLQLVGDEAATSEVCDCLNRLQEMTR